ncbi:MAG: hypothetical protein HQL90_10435 [Magnetococcales bacterium]|nr:hypothetical protein [Magnetococcales bacterium]
MKHKTVWSHKGLWLLIACAAAAGVARPLMAETLYYPGYLSYYPYGEGSFVYSLPRQEVMPELQLPPTPPPKVVESPAGLLPPAVAAFSPNQAEVPRVMQAGFSVHVGSFLKSSEAEELEGRLQKLGIPFFLAPAVINGVSYTQLHAGPFQIQDQAFTTSDAIRDNLGIQGIVLAYGPQQNATAGK